MDVGNWLRGLRLGQYAAAFQENAVDAETLRKLTAEDLKELGVSLVGHRRKLLEAIAALTDDHVSSIGSRSAVDFWNDDGKERGIETAERRQLTILFCDLVGSTALSAQLDPEDLRKLIHIYHAATAQEVERFGGFIAKYMGDGVLAYFGFPHAHENDAERALLTGLALVERVGQLQHDQAGLAVRVGIATGVVIVGDLIGHGSAQEHGVVGETPNLAARLQALAKPGSVLMDEATRRLVGELFEFRDLGAVEIKGMPAPANIWQLLGTRSVESRFEALHARGLSALVGRDHELGHLIRHWELAKAGEGQTVLVSGEPGIGKSRLAAGLQETVRDHAQITLRYFCSPHHRDSMLYPFIAQLELWAGFVRDDSAPAKLDKLRKLLASLDANSTETISLLADLLGIIDDSVPELSIDSQRKRELTIAIWPDLFKALARRRPLVVIFEDAHWADATSLELLDRAVSKITHLPALLVVTFRPEFQARWVGQSRVSALILSKLPRPESSALIAGITGGKALPQEIVNHIIERTDGIPLFIEELTSMLVESGLLREEQGEYVIEQPMPAMAIPSSLQASLMARLDRLAPVKEVAQIGAVIGREFSYELLAAVARRSDPELKLALDKLTDAGLVFAEGTPPHASYMFKHALVQDAAYSTLLRARKQDLHGRIGYLLAERFPDIKSTQPELLAHHFTEAGLSDAAVDYWRKAGERALDRSAHAEAAAHLTHAVRILGRLPESIERNHRELRLQMALGSTMRALKGHAADETLQVFLRARSLLDETIPLKEQMAVLYGAWTVTVVGGDQVLALEIARQSLALTQNGSDAEAIAFASRMNGIAFWLMGDFEQAVPHLERAVALYEPGSGNVTDLRYSQDHAVWALSVLALALWPLGYPDQAAAAAVRSLKWARAIDHGMSTGFSLSFGSALWGFFSEGPRPGGASAQEALDFCVEHDLRAYISWGKFYCGLSLVRSGEHCAGLELLRAGIAGMDRINFRVLWTAQLGLFAWALGAAGEVKEGLDELSRALVAVDKSGARFFELELHRLRGDLLRCDGILAEAEAEYERAIEIARAQKAKSWELRASTSLARLRIDQGCGTQALELLRPIYSSFTEGLGTRDLQQARILLDSLNGA